MLVLHRCKNCMFSAPHARHVYGVHANAVHVHATHEHAEPFYIMHAEVIAQCIAHPCYE